MTIWLLGGSGYIGSHLLSKFLAEGRKDIIVVDKDCTNVLDFEKECQLWQLDLSKHELYFKDGDIIYALQTMDHYPSEFDKEGAYRDVYQTTEKIVGSCKDTDCFFVFTSSRTVYGNAKGWIDENCPLNPTTCYGKLKKQCEELIQHNLESYAIIRLSNVYGGFRPLAQYIGVADKFMNCALSGLPLRVEGGKSLFDFTFIDDVINGLKALPTKPQRNYTVHFTCGRGIDTAGLAYLVKGITESKSKIVFDDPRPWEKDPPYFMGNPTKCKELLGLEFKTTLWEGLTKMKNRYLRCRFEGDMPYCEYLKLYGEDKI